jgi:hypothetical protein
VIRFYKFELRIPVKTSTDSGHHQKSGRLPPDSLDGILRIQWAACFGFTGRHAPDYAHILTEALLAYHTLQGDMNIHELSSKLDQIKSMLQENGVPSHALEIDVGLSEQFIASIRTAVKPGIKT